MPNAAQPRLVDHREEAFSRDNGSEPSPRPHNALVTLPSKCHPIQVNTNYAR